MTDSLAEYVALGSSFGAGPGLKPRAANSPRRSGRSVINYAHLFAQAAQLRLRDVTFSGATTADLLRPNARGEAAQLNAVTPATRVVTMSVGGNDVGYLPTLTLSSLPGPLLALPRVRRQLEEARDPHRLDRAFDDLAARLAEIVTRVRAVAPEARVVFVDYLTILPPQGAAVDLGRLPAPVADWGRGVASRLTQTFRSAAAEVSSDVLPAAEASANHHAWSTEPWTRRFHYGLSGGAPYHPNAAGMRAVARMLGELL
ncbi:SGNH/GDSL hydrolase family protein [Leifsonia sp. NPDC077715]|uniref:SGNH/GDSL hydrolase family protein n=1 Tax=Leifsonia sp. NPDC077715 TaxID=3155539 RepID=UPI003421D275